MEVFPCVLTRTSTRINAQRNLNSVGSSMSKSIERLSSGLRINRAGDDAAGLSISEKLRGQTKGLNQAVRNAQDGISMIQTAEGGLNETHSILQRMRELAVQGANDTLTNTDRGAIASELTSLKNEVDRIANNTEFNTKKLLNGGMSTALAGGLRAAERRGPGGLERRGLQRERHRRRGRHELHADGGRHDRRHPVGDDRRRDGLPERHPLGDDHDRREQPDARLQHPGRQAHPERLRRAPARSPT